MMTTRNTRSNKNRLQEQFPVLSEPSATTEQPHRRQTRRHKENKASEDERPLVGKFVKYPRQTPVKTSSSIEQKSSKRNRAALKDKNQTVDEIIPQDKVDEPNNARRTKIKKNVSNESFGTPNVKEQHVHEQSVKIADIKILLNGVDKSDTEKETDTKVSVVKHKKKSKRRGKNKVDQVNTQITLDLTVETDKPKTRKQEQKGQEFPMASANTSADSFHSAAGSPTHRNRAPDMLQTSTHSDKGLDSKANVSKSTMTFKVNSFEEENNTFVPHRISPNKKNSSSSPNTSNELISKQKLSGSKNYNFADGKAQKIEYSLSNTVGNNLPSSSLKENVFNETFDKSPEKRKSSCSSIINDARKMSEDIFSTSIMLVDSSVDSGTIFFNSTKEEAKSNGIPSTEISTFQKNSLNETFDKSPKCSGAKKREINSKPQKTTPVLVREGTFTKENEITPTNQIIQSLVRESTFTKEISSKQVTPQNQSVQNSARDKKSLSAPGSTPYHINKEKRTRSTEKSLTMLNITHSLEKDKNVRRSSTVVGAVRQTKVMFCSPVLNQVRDMERKSRIIKSNLKGSNKSFMYEEPSSAQPPSSRKRSYTHGDADNIAAKRKKLNDELNESVNRLSRPLTTTASRTEAPMTPNNKQPLRKSVSETKPTSVRSKVPDFAALHKKAFERMESLSECQERKARRAQQILQFSSGQYSLDGRKSPTVNTSFKQTMQSHSQDKKEHVMAKIARPCIRQPSQKLEESAKNMKIQLDEQEIKEAAKAKIVRPVTKTALPKLESTNGLGNKSYTRFGFKLNSEINPFSIPSAKPNPVDVPTAKSKLVKQATKEKLNHTVTNTSKHGTKPLTPSLNGTVSGLPSMRKEKSKNALIREISATALTERKKRETRDIIKGVRTNRRFELQMKSRNMN